MVLGKLTVPECPTNLDQSSARIAVGAGEVCFGHFFHVYYSLFFSGRRPYIDRNTECLKGP